jgi:hypothetical protein
VSHELHNLVTKIENACDPDSYEVADTEYLVRLAVAEYVVAQNGLVASARVVEPTAVQKVIDRHIRENISAADPHTWFGNVATKIADFLELAYEDRTNNESAEHVDLLPIGHPRNTKNFGLTASARMEAIAEWVAADPRITTDLGRQAVYSAFRAKPDSLEATYANAKIEALCASGVLPADFAYEAIVASFKKMSFAERSARSRALAKVRRYDRRRRYANEFGRLRGFFSKGDGSMFSATGKIAGAVPGKNKYYVEFDGSDPEIPKGVYIQDASKSENVRALLSQRTLKNAPNLRKPVGDFNKFDQESAVDLNEFLATKVESPGDWTKNRDGSFSSETGNKVKEVDSLPEGDYYFEGVGENNEQDLGEPLFEIRDANDELVGVAQDWNGIQKIALTNDSMKERADKKASEINDQTFAEALEALDDETNWDNLDTEPSYESPNGVLGLSFTADGDTDGEGGMVDASGWSASLDPDGEDIQIASWRGGPNDDMGDIMERIEAGYKEYKAKKAAEAKPEAATPNQKPEKYRSTLEKDSSGGYSTNPGDDALIDVTKEKDGKWSVGHSYNYLRDERDDEYMFDEGEQSFDSEADALAFAKEKLEYYNTWDVNDDAEDAQFRGGPTTQSEKDRNASRRQPTAPAQESKAPTQKTKPSYLDKKPKQYQSTLEKDSLGYSTGVDDDGFVEVRKNKDGGYDVNHGYNHMPADGSSEVQFDEDSKTFPTEQEALDFANEKLDYYNSYRVDEDAAEDVLNRASDAGDDARERGLGQDVPEAEAPAKEAKPLSEKQMEPATPKQYALLKEFQEERDGIDENQNQAINDALEKQNLSKAQMASLFGDLQKKPFKPEVDPSRPSDRMINSLRDYLTNKDLTPDEITSALDELEAGLDRAGVEKLLNKLRRRPDKAKEEGLGQDIPSDLVLTPQGLANGFDFDRSSDGKTWSVDGGGLDAVNVEVTENNGKWFTLERSGGNNETGFTRESEKQHGSAQEAFEYAAEVANRRWDQDLYDDLNNDFGDDEDEIGFAEEEGLGQELPATGTPDLSDIDADESWVAVMTDDGNPFGTPREFIDSASYISPDGRVKAEANYDTDGESQGLYLSIELDGKELNLPEDEYDLGTTADLGDVINAVESAIKRETGSSEQGLSQAAPSTKMAEDATDAQYNYVSSMLNGKEVPEELATAAKQGLEDRNLSKAQIGEIIGKMRDLPNKEGFDPNAPTERMIESVKRNIVAKGLSQEDQDSILQDLPNMDKATMSELIGRLKAMDDVNAPEEGLGQQSVDDLDAEVEELASELDGETEPFTSGNGLRRSIEDFNDARYRKYPDIRMQSVNDIRDLAADRIVDINGMNISERLNNLADKLEAQLIERFGVADVARTSESNDSIELDDVRESVQAEKEMFFETDSNVLADKLTASDSYGDTKSGGAEVFISKEEDGTYTASVMYDRDSEEFKSEDRDEVVQQAAAAAADYNRDVIPSSYFEDADLSKDAEGAKSDEEALAFADRIIQLADDLENNRGDQDVAGNLKDYAERIQALVEKRKGQAPEQGLGQQADSNESTAAQAARADRAQDIAIDKLPAEASEEELEMEASDIEAKLAEIDSLAADNDRLGLRELELNSDYQDVRAEINAAKARVDAQTDKEDAAKNAEIDDAIASGDISKLESLLRDPDYKGFDLVIQDAINELEASEEGLGQEAPKA